MSNEKRAVICLTPSKSRRLLARAVTCLPQVKAALTRGRIIVALGSTNAYVAEELGHPRDARRFMAGYIGAGGFGVASDRLEPVVLVDGQLSEQPWEQVLDEFGAGDVFIKGANAIDPWGHAGILLRSNTGGTIGRAYATLQARGSHLIVVAGLEKLIASVLDVASELGLGRIAEGSIGMMPLVSPALVTEIEALELLADVEAIQCGAGGIGGGEGSVVLLVAGTESSVDEAVKVVSALRDEPPVVAPD